MGEGGKIIKKNIIEGQSERQVISMILFKPVSCPHQAKATTFAQCPCASSSVGFGNCLVHPAPVTPSILVSMCLSPLPASKRILSASNGNSLPSSSLQFRQASDSIKEDGNAQTKGAVHASSALTQPQG